MHIIPCRVANQVQNLVETAGADPHIRLSGDPFRFVTCQKSGVCHGHAGDDEVGNKGVANIVIKFDLHSDFFGSCPLYRAELSRTVWFPAGLDEKK